MFIGGIFLSYLFSKTNTKVRLFRYFIWAIPFAIYFAFNPIFEGDFSNNYRELPIKKGLIQAESNQLIVVTIPGCPFCMASIKTIKEIQNRVPNLNVKYVVCSSDTTAVALYKEEIKGSFPITIAPNLKEYARITQGKFPSYMLISKSFVRIWSNDGFGAIAKDEVKAYFSELY